MMRPSAQPNTASGAVTWRQRRKAAAWYLGLSAAGHLCWEVAQLPLYGLWATATNSELAFAILHCTAGDSLIAATVLLAALVLCRAVQWPKADGLRVATVAVLLGVIYTAFSEWLNVYVRQSWSYSTSMPTVSVQGFDIGLSPLLQWLIVPALVFAALQTITRRQY